MERRASIPISVMVARTCIDNPWQSHVWRPAGAMVGRTTLQVGSVMRGDAATTFYFAGTAPLELFSSDVESYRTNLAQDVPRLYVILDVSGEDSVPTLQLVTAAPDEAESYLEGDGRLVDGIPMAPGLVDLLAAYVAEYPPASPASKRRLRSQSDPVSAGSPVENPPRGQS